MFSPPKIISERPQNAKSKKTTYWTVTFSPRIGPARKKETSGAQFRTITETVSVKYFVAMNKAKIAKLLATTLTARGFAQDGSIESYITFLRLLLW